MMKFIIILGCILTSCTLPSTKDHVLTEAELGPEIGIIATVASFQSGILLSSNRISVDYDAGQNSKNDIFEFYQAAILDVNKSSIDGPDQIIIFFEHSSKNIELFKRKGVILSFKMHSVDFKSAEYKGLLGMQKSPPFVFSKELKAIKVEGTGSGHR